MSSINALFMILILLTLGLFVACISTLKMQWEVHCHCLGKVSWTQGVSIFSLSKSMGSMSRHGNWALMKIREAKLLVDGDAKRGRRKTTTENAWIWRAIRQYSCTPWTSCQCYWTFANWSYSQPLLVVEDTITTVSTFNTPHVITPLTTFAPIGVSKKRIQELLCL